MSVAVVPVSLPLRSGDRKITQPNAPAPTKGITCLHCDENYPIQPGSSDETLCFRALLAGRNEKAYFCDLLCYLSYTRPEVYHGFRVLPKHQVNYFHKIQHAPGHEDWKPVPWLEKAYRKVNNIQFGKALASDAEPTKEIENWTGAEGEHGDQRDEQPQEVEQVE